MRPSRLSILPLSFAWLVAACGPPEDGEPGGPVMDGDPQEPAAMCSARPLSPLPQQGFFSDISDASGIRAGNFQMSPPVPIPINDHSRLGLADLDGDGWDDMVMHSLFPNPLKGIPFEHLVFMNNRDGTFRDASDASGLRGVQAGFFAFGDVDNDGDIDAFAGLDIPLAGESNRILLNDGKGRFAVRPGSGVETAESLITANAVFADFDGDGRLDLYLGNGQTGYLAADRLYLGNGDGTFRDVTATHLLSRNPERPTNGLVACDYDDDGDVDVLVATYGVSVELGHDILWENDGKGRFTDVALARGFAAQATGNYFQESTGHGTQAEPGKGPSEQVGGNGFGIDCQDVSGDGLPDVLVTAISHPSESEYSRKWSDPTQLLINQGRGAGFAFKNEFLERKLPFNEGDVDGALIDFDNDGRIDLSLSRDTKYETRPEYTADDQRSWFGLMHQIEGGAFESVGVRSGINDPGLLLKRMKGAQNHAWSDIDHDGDLDLLVGGRDQGGGRPNFLFRNDAGSKNTWLAVRLRGDGKKVNRDAIGARVTIRGKGLILTRELKSSRGTYNSLDTRVLHFGLGDIGCDLQMEVRWPDGRTDPIPRERIALNSYMTIDYAEGGK